MTTDYRFDPDKLPAIKAMRRHYEREQKAEAEAEKRRNELQRRAQEARNSAEEREELAEELKREIRAAFVNGNDDKATKLRAKQEGEMKRAEVEREKAKALEKEAENIGPEKIEAPEPGTEPGRYWTTVTEAIEEEFCRVAAQLACVGAMAYNQRAHWTQVTPGEFAKRALDKNGILKHRIPALEYDDRIVPRKGLIAELLQSAEVEEVA